MSKDISVFPRNFLRQPQVRDMVPDVKLTFLALLIECESAIGCWIPGSIDDAVNIKHLSGAFDELERRGELSIDKKTGEFFITGFFRWNYFTGAKRVGQARDSFAQVRSNRLRKEILEQVKLNQRFCRLAPASLSDEGSSKNHRSVDNFCKNYFNQQHRTQGEGEGEGEGEAILAAADDEQPIIQNPTDSRRFEELIAQYGTAAVMAALKTATAAGRRPYVSNISKQLLKERQHGTSSTASEQARCQGGMDDPLGYREEDQAMLSLVARGGSIDGTSKRL